MKIYFSGAQSTGKTTIFNELKSLYMFRDFKQVTNVARDMAKLGMGINEEGSDISQRIISSAFLYNHIMYENLISDRSNLDTYVYGLWLYKRGKISKDVYNFSKEIFQFTFKTTDVIFLTPVEFDMVSDGVRSEDKDFREEINEIFMELGPRLQKVVPIYGSTQERLSFVLEFIKHNIFPPEEFALDYIEETKLFNLAERH